MVESREHSGNAASLSLSCIFPVSILSNRAAPAYHSKWHSYLPTSKSMRSRKLSVRSCTPFYHFPTDKFQEEERLELSAKFAGNRMGT